MTPAFRVLAAFLSLALASAALAAPSPVKLIFDTDMDSDCDDVGALGMLHALADRGEVEILATTVSSKNPWSPLCVSAINQFFGRPDVPVGVPKGHAGRKETKYAQKIAEQFPRKLESADKAPDAIAVWRTALEKAEDGSVTIVTVGYLSNVAELLKRPAQGDRPSGLDLAKQKVKVWVCMGGNFVGDPPKDDLKLTNNNFTFDREASLYAVKNWPTKLVFVGREIGSVPSGLKVGAKLKELPAGSPIRKGYELYFGGVAKDRHVADQSTLLYATRGLGEYWMMRGPGFMELAPDNQFSWSPVEGGRQYYLFKKPGTDRAVEKVIEELMMAGPKKD
ncbi:MAG: nucleoside hydrolase [Phycisphaerae bacterium]